MTNIKTVRRNKRKTKETIHNLKRFCHLKQRIIEQLESQVKETKKHLNEFFKDTIDV